MFKTEDNLLNDFQTFEEFPNRFLLVENNSNIFYIKIKNQSFVARQNIDSVSEMGFNSKDIIKYETSYYNIQNGECILNLTILESIKGQTILELQEDCMIIPLSDVLNIKSNGKYYLSRKEVNILNSFENENKVYKKSPKWTFIKTS